MTEKHDQIFVSSHKLHGRPHSTPRILHVHSAWRPTGERATAVSQTGHITLLLPSSHLDIAKLVAEEADLPT